jgi:hypothetical protein
MRKWLRKSLLVLVSAATFGLITPQALLADSSNEDKQPKRDIYQSNASPPIEVGTVVEETKEICSPHDQFVINMVQEAKEKSFEKFGTRIGPIIEDEFTEVILPSIEKVILEVAAQYPEEDLSQLTISERPSGGTSEKIFHIINEKTKKDVIRFHVRRDHPPQESFAFNFHYHTEHDQFQTHHDLGVIYWDKNTPPHWMS